MNNISIFILVNIVSLITGLVSMIIMAYDKKRIMMWGKIAITALIINIVSILFGLTYLFLLINNLIN
jgi:hypothetical protein